MYRGELSRMEMDQGLGMGMAVAGPSLGIFSLVTGAAGSAGNGNSSSVGMKRSFAGALLQPDSGASNLGGKRTTSLKRGLSMGGPSFVFTSESSALSRHGTTTQGGSASMHGSHVGNSSAGGDGSMGGQSLANGSLFEKLKRSHTSNK